MIYVEWLRARKRLAIYAIVLVAAVVLAILSVQFGHFHESHNGRHHSTYWTLGWASSAASGDRSSRDVLHDYLRSTTIGFDSLLMAGNIVAFLFCIGLCTSLQHQYESLHLAFTKPLSRTRLALTFFAVDFATIAAVFVLVVVLGLLFIAVFGGLDRIIAPHPGVIVGLGAIVLLYGLMQAATSGLRGGRRGIVTALWVSFVVVLAIRNTPFPQINAVANALSWLDPIRYLGTDTSHGIYLSPTGIGGYGLEALAAWGFGIVACALAIFAWNRVEV